MNRSKHATINGLIAAAAVIVVPLAGCNPDTQPSQSAASAKVQTVTVAKAQRDEVVDSVDLVGRTAANELVDIRSRVSGFLLKRHFDDGQTVKKGDLLFTIESDQYEAINNQSLAQILVAKSQVELADKTFRRSQKLLESNAVSRQEFEQNQAQVEVARAQLVAAKANAERTKLDVEYTKIISPIDGRVDRRLVDEGNYVTGGATGGTVLTTVVNDRPIKALADIDENTVLTFMRRQREVAGDDFVEADKVAEMNIPCYLKLADEEGYPHEGKVEYAEIRVNQSTGTSQMRAVFDNKNGLLKVGMFVRMRVPVSDPYEAVLVPDRAVGTDQATRFVFIVDENKTVQQRQVTLGDRKGGLRVIKSGVKPGESVVVAGLQLIQPGMKVETELAGGDGAKPEADEAETADKAKPEAEEADEAESN